MRRVLTKPWYAIRVKRNGVPEGEHVWHPIGTVVEDVRVLANGIDWRAKINGVLWEADEGGGMPVCDPPVSPANPPRPRPSGRSAHSSEVYRTGTAVQIRLSDAQVVALDALRSVRGESRAGCVHRIVSAALESVSASMRVAK